MNTKSRVALFSTNFLEYSQTFIFDEIRYHQKYEVEVFSHKRVNENRFQYKPLNFLSPANTLKNKIESAIYGITTYSPTYMQKMKAGNFSLIHAHFGPGSIYTLLYQKALQIPLITTVHGYDVPLLLTNRKLLPQYWRYWWRSKAMFNQTTRFLAASNELHDMLLELGAPPEKVKIWRLGIEIPEISYPTDRNNTKIMMVGRFVEKKGFEYGIEAFGKISQTFQDATLLIAGSGERREIYDRIIDKYNIKEKVIFLGALTHRELLKKMEEIDIFIAPSVVAKNGDRESGLLVAKEAGARFVPVIGTYHGGIPEIIDTEKTGFLVPERNSDIIAEKIAILLKNHELRQIMGYAAREKMEKEYNIIERIGILEEHYDEVIKEFQTK